MHLLVDASVLGHDWLKAAHLFLPLCFLNYKLVFWLGNDVGMRLTTVSDWMAQILALGFHLAAYTLSKLFFVFLSRLLYLQIMHKCPLFPHVP